MKTDSILYCLALVSLVAARPVPNELKVLRREVPQEHSHEQFIFKVREALRLNNPAGIGDPVFGLLGNAVRLFPLLFLVFLRNARTDLNLCPIGWC
jgi:hypothetical protein